MKTIGIIGGMGPEATIDLYSKIVKLTRADKDQEHLHVIIDSYPQIPDRTAHILGKGVDPTPYLVESAQRLEKAGADVLCMPCNTAHHFLPLLKQQVKVPFISMIKSVVSKLLLMPQNPKKVFVMATVGTRVSKVYESELLAHNFEVLPIPEDLQQDLMNCIYDGVKKGKTLDYVPLFRTVINKLSAKGPHALIAACTELPLLTTHISTEVPIIDATFELAKACVEFAYKEQGQ